MLVLVNQTNQELCIDVGISNNNPLQIRLDKAALFYYEIVIISNIIFYHVKI